MAPEERRAWNKADYERRKQRYLDYLGGACAQCGSSTDLHFDHVDPSTKLFTITGNINRRWAVLSAELDKCQLLCAPCHRSKSKKNKEYGGGENRWTEIKHGTLHAYTDPKYRCRCDLCVNAMRKSRGRGPRPEPKQVVCGTYAMYKRGCRCSSCKTANNEYMREYRLRKQLPVVQLEKTLDYESRD